MPDALAEVKRIVTDIGGAFEEYKGVVDSKFEAMKKDRGTAETDEKLDKMQDAIDTLETKKAEFEATIEGLETKMNRPGNTGGDEGPTDAEKAYEDLFVGGFMRKGRETPELEQASELRLKAANVTTAADGGYAIPETLDRAIERYEEEGNPMRGASRVIRVSDENYKKLASKGDAASGWVGEATARTETTTPTLAELTPTFGEIYANPASTQRALDDIMFDVGGWLAEEVGMEFASQENAAFTVGDGVNKPKGLLDNTTALTTDATRAIGTLQHRATGHATLLGTADDDVVNNLIDLEIDLKPAYRTGAQWMFNRSVLRILRKLRNTNGDLIWTPGLQAGAFGTIHGYGYTENEDFPAVAAASLSVAFGNFKRSFWVVDVRGARMLRDPYTNKPYVHFYTTKRMGSLLVNSEAVKLLKTGV